MPPRNATKTAKYRKDNPPPPVEPDPSEERKARVQNIIRHVSRDKMVEILERYFFQCYPHETPGQLAEDIVADEEDGDIPTFEIDELLAEVDPARLIHP